MKVNLDVPEALYKRLRTQATVRGMKVKDFMVVFMEEGLERLSAGESADSPALKEDEA